MLLSSGELHTERRGVARERQSRIYHLAGSYRGLCRRNRKEKVQHGRLKATAATCWGTEPRPNTTGTQSR